MNNQNTNRTGRAAYLGLALTAAFLTYCLGVGTVTQSKDAEIRQIQATSVSREAEARRMGVLQTVYTVCNDSRMSATITEASCGALQDVTKTEFLCEDRGTSPSIRCWVEDKSGADSKPFLVYPKQ